MGKRSVSASNRAEPAFSEFSAFISEARARRMADGFRTWKVWIGLLGNPRVNCADLMRFEAHHDPCLRLPIDGHPRCRPEGRRPVTEHTGVRSHARAECGPLCEPRHAFAFMSILRCAAGESLWPHDYLAQARTLRICSPVFLLKLELVTSYELFHISSIAMYAMNLDFLTLVSLQKEWQHV